MTTLKGAHFHKSIGLIILAVILYYVDLNEVCQQLKNSTPIYIVAAILLILPQVSLRAHRWQKMLVVEDIRCTFRRALSFYFAGIYIGLMTPGRLGEVAKAYFLKKCGLASFSQTLPSIIADRCFDLYFLSLLAATSLYFIGIGITSPIVGVLITLIIGGAPLLLICIWRSGRFSDWIGDVVFKRWGQKWGASYKSFSRTTDRLLSARMTYMMALTIASYGIYFLQTWLIGRSVGLELNYATISKVVSIAILIGYAPITIAGLGTREAVLIYLFDKFGVSVASALSFAIIYNLVYIVCMGVVSMLFWLTLPRNERSIRKPGQSEWIKSASILKKC